MQPGYSQLTGISMGINRLISCFWIHFNKIFTYTIGRHVKISFFKLFFQATFEFVKNVVCPTPPCVSIQGSILGVIPGDFDFNGLLDMLVVNTDSTGATPTYNIVDFNYALFFFKVYSLSDRNIGGRWISHISTI